MNKIISWYPGHMAKTKRLIREIINTVDIVIEIIDARIPKSSHIKDIDDFIKNKKIIIVFNKYDLCDKKETLRWKNYYENLGYIVLTCNSKEENKSKLLVDSINNLMSKENIKRKSLGLLPKKAKALIVGVPNVGKSTFINRLINKKIMEVGNKPGITRNIKTLRIHKNIDLIDTPGILWPKIEEEETALNLASMNIIKEEVLPLDNVAIHILDKLNNYYPDILEKEFNIKEFDMDNIEEIYNNISNYKKFNKINNEVDYDKINLYIINQIKSEKIKGITFDRM